MRSPAAAGDPRNTSLPLTRPLTFGHIGRTDAEKIDEDRDGDVVVSTHILIANGKKQLVRISAPIDTASPGFADRQFNRGAVVARTPLPSRSDDTSHLTPYQCWMMKSAYGDRGLPTRLRPKHRVLLIPATEDAL